MDEPQVYEVCGQMTVGGVEPGGTVTLDPAVVNIRALLKARLVRPAVPPPKDEPKRRKGGRA